MYCPGGARDVVKLLVGNKVDKPAVVSREEAEDWARGHGMLFLEASAKTDVGIAQAFEEVLVFQAAAGVEKECLPRTGLPVGRLLIHVCSLRYIRPLHSCVAAGRWWRRFSTTPCCS